jgi:Cu/Ag efflux protein CusF
MPVSPLTPDQPAAPEPNRGAGWRSWVIAAVVVALVAGGVGFMMSRSSNSSSAATTPQNSDSSGAPSSGGPRGGARQGTRGTVTKIDGSDITVETTDQSGTKSTTVVRTSGDTTYTQSVSGSITDLKTGDSIVVTGQSSNGAVTATAINDTGSMTFGRRNGNGNGNSSGGPPNFSGAPPNGGNFPNGGQGGARGPGGNFTIGQIKAIDGSTITLSSFNGDSVTVTTTGTTTFTVTKSASLSDVKVGDTIAAAGNSSNGVVTATNVRIGDTGFGPGGFGFGGGGFGGRRPPANSNNSQSEN